MAALVAPIVISGSRLSTGDPNDTGTVYAYQPGTTTPAVLYADAAASVVITQPITLDAGGRAPYDTYPNGVWITAPVRLLIQDADGGTVSDSTYWSADARTTALVNDGWTNEATVDEAFTALWASTGGADGLYQESSGATARAIQDKFREPGISVKDFGAAGDGITIDTTAIQTAVNRAKVLSCPVLFPAGTYIIDQSIALSSATGVSIVGVGGGYAGAAVTIKTTSTTANIFTLTSCTGFEVKGIAFTATADNSGSAVAMTSCTYYSVQQCAVTPTGGGSFVIPFSASACTDGIYWKCTPAAKAADATARVYKFAGNCARLQVIGGFASAFTGAIGEFTGAAGDITFGNVVTSGTATGLLWSGTGTGFTVYGCTFRESISTFSTAFDQSGLSTDPNFRQWANGVDGYTQTVLSGGTATVQRYRGPEIRFDATTTGAAQIIPAPTPTPLTTMRDVYLDLHFYAHAGGALTGWTMNAIYHTSAGPSTTDTQHTFYRFKWDADASVWRELSRAVTT